MTVVNSDYWLERYFISRDNQRADLELARLNPRGSSARQAWLEASRLDGIGKRLHWNFHAEDAAREQLARDVFGEPARCTVEDFEYAQ